jgi:hypothetical protein
MGRQAGDNVPGSETDEYRNCKTHDQAKSEQHLAGLPAILTARTPANDEIAYDELQHQHRQCRNGNPDHCAGSFTWPSQAHAIPLAHRS